MIYKPENVKLVITHNGVEREVQGFTDNPISFDESTFVENPQPKKTIVEVMLNDECYERGYNQAIDDVVFELNNQGVDSDIISLIEGM